MLLTANSSHCLKTEQNIFLNYNSSTIHQKEHCDHAKPGLLSSLEVPEHHSCWPECIFSECVLQMGIQKTRNIKENVSSCCQRCGSQKSLPVWIHNHPEGYCCGQQTGGAQPFLLFPLLARIWNFQHVQLYQRGDCHTDFY